MPHSFIGKGLPPEEYDLGLKVEIDSEQSNSWRLPVKQPYASQLESEFFIEAGPECGIFMFTTELLETEKKKAFNPMET